MNSKTTSSKKLNYFFVISVISFFLNFIFIYQNYQKNIVSYVPDGDSLQLKDGRRVRLLGIDAPEKDRCFGQEAWEKLNGMAKGKHVRLKDVLTDDYGRILSNVIIEEPESWQKYIKWWLAKKFGLNTTIKPDPFLNRVMVRNGLAKFESISSQYFQVLKDAQEIAKIDKIGIWSEICRGSIPKAGCNIKGNIRNGVKSYYTDNCQYYHQVIVDQSYGDSWFCSTDEATQSGFILSPSCF